MGTSQISQSATQHTSSSWYQVVMRAASHNSHFFWSATVENLSLASPGPHVHSGDWASAVPGSKISTREDNVMADLPQRQGLYDPAFEHDACGVSFVVDIQGRA